MPSREERKIVKWGTSSKVISLPKPFLDYHNIQEGDKVLLLYDSIILVLPAGITEETLSDKADLIKKLLE